MTRDGHIVCFHDDDLERTTNGTGKIWEYTLAQLQRLDAGYWFRKGGDYPFRGRGLTIPTLEEVMALDPQARVNLEIKQARPSMLATMWQRIEALGVHDRVLVASADARLVRGFRNLARGQVATSAGRAEIFAFWLAVRGGLHEVISIEYDALQVPVSSGPLEVVNPRFVRAAHARGIAVHVWTIDDVAQMRALIDLGVDGIMTDQPQDLADLVRQLGCTPTLGAAT